METLYYFRYVVNHVYNHEFQQLYKARLFAEANNEKVYLTIFHKHNSFHEPYADELITTFSEVDTAKEKLIQTFNKCLES